MPLDIARLATGNVTLLKELTLQEVLEIHPLLHAQGFAFGKARKTKPIKARPINTILDKSCPSVYEALLLNTLEAAQKVQPGSMICWGEAGDVWQQARAKLEQKYNPTGVDEDGFVTYVPKDGADAVMNAHQVTSEHQLGPHGGFCILNPWWGDTRYVNESDVRSLIGDTPFDCGSVTIVKPDSDDAKKDSSRIGKAKVCLHYGVDNDWVLQNQTDTIDVYRVAKSFFESTYEVE